MPDAEQTATSNDPKHQLRDDARFSPGAGCIIIIMIISLFSGVIAFAIYNGLKQDKDIGNFTFEKPIDIPNEPGTADQVNAVRQKLSSFKSTIRQKLPATLELSTSDLNILLHNETALIEIREMIYFESITPDIITGKLAMPLNRLAFWKPRRYINGDITMFIEASEGRLFLRLKNINSPGKNIPPGFIERIGQDDLLNPYKTEENEDIFASIYSATMNNGSVVIESKPVEDGKQK